MCHDVISFQKVIQLMQKLIPISRTKDLSAKVKIIFLHKSSQNLLNILSHRFWWFFSKSFTSFSFYFSSVFLSILLLNFLSLIFFLSENFTFYFFSILMYCQFFQYYPLFFFLSFHLFSFSQSSFFPLYSFFFFNLFHTSFFNPTTSLGF